MPRPEVGSALPPPIRLQRPRHRNGRLTPPGAVYVGRPSLWANPFLSRRFGHVAAVQLHRRWLRGTLSPAMADQLGFNAEERAALARLRRQVLARIGDLAGRDLQCWCPLASDWCHAAALIALAQRHG